MGIQDLAAAAQILAAVAVTASVLYLALQVRQSNAESRAQARYSFVQAYGQLNLSLATSLQAASMMRRGMAEPAALTDDESLQFFLVLGQFGNTWNALWELHEDGLFPAGLWVTVRKDILTVLRTPGGSAFWRDSGRGAFDPAFVAQVDAWLASGEAGFVLP